MASTGRQYLPNWQVSKTTIQSGVIACLVFLGVIRWMPGGDALNVEGSVRAYLELALLSSAFAISLLFWGITPILRAFRSPVFLITVLYGVWAFISAVWAPDLVLSLGKAAGFLMLIISAGMVAERLGSESVSPERVIFPITVIGILFLFGINWVQLGSPFAIQLMGTRMRFSLGYDHPNDASFIFFLLIFFSAFFFEKQKKIVSKLFLTLIGLGGALGLYFTDSRTAIALTVLFLFSVLLIKVKSKRLVFVLIISVLFFGSLLLFVFSAGSFDAVIQFSPDRNLEYSTLNGRIQLWENLIAISESSPWIGQGYFSTRKFGLAAAAWAYTSHNTLLEVFFSLGFVGVILAVSVIFFSGTLLKNVHKNFFPLALLMYLLLEGILEVYLFIPTMRMFILSLFVVYYQLSQFSNKPSRTRSLVEG